MPLVLFLDIDGVLNSVETMRSGRWNAGTETLDPENVERLDRLIQLTGAVVVVSSTWRKTRPLGTITTLLEKAGLSSESASRFIGTTPELPSAYRGAEIQEWLGNIPSENFVILDDDSDMKPYMNRLVKVDGEWGLQDHDVEEALSLFGRQENGESPCNAGDVMDNCLNCGSPAASPDGKAPLCSTCQGEAKGRERGVSFMREIQSREQNTPQDDA